MRNIKFFLISSLLQTTAISTLSHAMENDDSRTNHMPNESLQLSEVVVLSSEFIQKIKDYDQGKLYDLNIDLFSISDYESFCLNGEDQEIYQRLLINKQIINSWPKVIDHIKTQANLGDACAQTNLAGMYAHGVGVKKDVNEALKLYRSAVKKEYAPAQTDLGGYLLSSGGAQNYTEALTLFKKGAENGYIPALLHIGVIYRYGLGVKKDANEAVRWLIKAAEQAYVPAQFDLGMMYIQGQDIQKNDNEGQKWLTKAAAGGHPDAQKILEALKEILEALKGA